MTTGFQFGISEFTTHPWSFERDVETYARLGVSAIEVCEAKLNPARISAQMDLIGAAGLEITSVQPKTRTLFPRLSQPEPKEIGERIKLFQQTIETLSPWTPGVAYVTNTGIPPGGSIQEVVDRAAKEYRALAEFAAGHGVRVALEPLNAFIGTLKRPFGRCRRRWGLSAPWAGTTSAFVWTHGTSGKTRTFTPRLKLAARRFLSCRSATGGRRARFWTGSCRGRAKSRCRGF